MKRLSILVMVAVTVSVVMLSLPQVNRAIEHKFQNPFVVRTIQTLNLPNNLDDLDGVSSHRLSLWGKCIEVWKENPILGCGQGQLYWELRRRGAQDAAANQLILVLGEMGILGLFIFLWALISIGKDLTRPFLANEIKLNYSNWLICSAMFVNILVQSLTVHIFHFPDLPLLVWIIIGMALASSRQDLQPAYSHH